MEERQKNLRNETMRKAIKKRNDADRYREKVKEMRERLGHENGHLFQKCNADECRNYIQVRIFLKCFVAFIDKY